LYRDVGEVKAIAKIALKIKNEHFTFPFD